MNKIILVSVILISANGFCFSQVENEKTVKQDTVIKKNMRTIVHIHPYSVFISIIGSRLEGPLFLYSTIEKPLNLSNSLIIKPSIWINASEFKIFGKSHEFSRFGCDIGIRHYPSEKGKGFYIQGVVGFFYADYNEKHIENTGTMDIMGYMGYSWDVSKRMRIFWDVGVGLGLGGNLLLGEDAFFIPDINFGLGFKF
jgi:hypothetical protein